MTTLLSRVYSCICMFMHLPYTWPEDSQKLLCHWPLKAWIIETVPLKANILLHSIANTHYNLDTDLYHLSCILSYSQHFAATRSNTSSLSWNYCFECLWTSILSWTISKANYPQPPPEGVIKLTDALWEFRALVTRSLEWNSWFKRCIAFTSSNASFNINVS